MLLRLSSLESQISNLIFQTVSPHTQTRYCSKPLSPDSATLPARFRPRSDRRKPVALHIRLSKPALYRFLRPAARDYKRGDKLARFVLRMTRLKLQVAPQTPRPARGLLCCSSSRWLAAGPSS